MGKMRLLAEHAAGELAGRGIPRPVPVPPPFLFVAQKPAHLTPTQEALNAAAIKNTKPARLAYDLERKKYLYPPVPVFSPFYTSPDFSRVQRMAC